MSDGAIAAIVSGAVTIATMLFAYLKLKYQAEEAKEEAKQAKTKAAQVEEKIDHNTTITKGGVAAAVSTAQVAANTAAEVKVATDIISKKLNGGIDSAIESAVKPIRQAMADHAIQDEANMKEIRSALEDIRRRLK